VADTVESLRAERDLLIERVEHLERDLTATVHTMSEARSQEGEAHMLDKRRLWDELSAERGRTWEAWLVGAAHHTTAQGWRRRTEESAAERDAARAALAEARGERDRACAEQVVAHACMVKAFSAKLEAEAERDAARAVLARLLAAAREAHDIAAMHSHRGRGMTVAPPTLQEVARVIEKTLAAALPPTPAEPPWCESQPLPRRQTCPPVQTLECWEPTPAEPPAPEPVAPGECPLCAQDEVHEGCTCAHTYVCDLCRRLAAADADADELIGPLADVLLALDVGDEMGAEPVAEAGPGACDECNGEGWIAHPAGTKFGCLHCHVCGGGGKGDLR
jgi:hypothetical protein